MRSSRWLTNDSEERVLWWFTVRSLKHVTWLVGDFGKSCSFVFVYYVINSMLACKISRTFYDTKKYVRFFHLWKVFFIVVYDEILSVYQCRRRKLLPKSNKWKACRKKQVETKNKFEESPSHRLSFKPKWTCSKMCLQQWLKIWSQQCEVSRAGTDVFSERFEKQKPRRSRNQM